MIINDENVYNSAYYLQFTMVSYHVFDKEGSSKFQLDRRLEPSQIELLWKSQWAVVEKQIRMHCRDLHDGRGRQMQLASGVCLPKFAFSLWFMFSIKFYIFENLNTHGVNYPPP